jgi:hypothetical protein
MGRFFLIILALQSIDMICTVLQSVFIEDLSQPFYEILRGSQPHRSPQTRLCQTMGFVHTLCDYMSQFYALWFAVLIKQVTKDPIHKMKRMINTFHLLTILIAGGLTLTLSKFHTFGV